MRALIFGAAAKMRAALERRTRVLVADDRRIQEQFPAIAQALLASASPQVRNMATIGGNLLQRPRCWYYRNARIDCWLKGGADCPAREGENRNHAILGGGPCYAVHPSDLAAALLAFDAALWVHGRGGERAIELADFFALPAPERRTETVLSPDDLRKMCTRRKLQR